MPTAAKIWHLLPHDRDAIERLARGLGMPPIVAQLLLNRGLSVPEEARRFLDAPLTDLHPPAALPGAVEAAGRLREAIEQGRRVCVYGDYDADGITGTAILWQALRLAGANPDFYVPHRLEEGYGLNVEALRQLARSGTALVVTVDCGITGVAEAEEARRLGLELIVTDHHEPAERLPEAAGLVHPGLPGRPYPFAGLCGAGVAFKVAWALCQQVSGSEKVAPRFREFLLDAVALAALGLIADVVPLQDENRVFVRHGLRRLQKAPSLGLRALLEASGIGEGKVLSAEDVGFKLAPRLNAAGRLGCARLVVELLTTTSKDRAMDLARFLDGQNQQRQQLERRILAEARERVESEGHAEAPALVLASPEWHAGVIGIVAGRLAEQFARPVLLIAQAQGQGSGRSVPGFPLHEALRECGEYLLSHGGHAAAAGFKIQSERIDVFRDRFRACAARHFAGAPMAPRLVLDAEVPLSALTFGLLQDLDRLEPYGSANRRPLLLAGGLQIVDEPRRLGNDQRHLGFRVRQEKTTLRAIAFGMGDRLDELMSAEGQCCLAFTPRINEWNNYRNIEMNVVDFQAGGQARLG